MCKQGRFERIPAGKKVGIWLKRKGMGGRTCGENVGAAPPGRGFGMRKKGWGFFKEGLVRLGGTRPRNDARTSAVAIEAPGQFHIARSTKAVDFHPI